MKNIVKMNEKRLAFVSAARSLLGEHKIEVTRSQIQEVLAANPDLPWPAWIQKESMRAGRGIYYLPTEEGHYETLGNSETVNSPIREEISSSVAPVVAMVPSAVSIQDHQQESYVPEKFDGYVPYGNFNIVRDVLKAGIFYPLFLTGLSGNGKTLLVKEICARLKREYIRANITIETDEDDLIGGFRLLNGETVWHDGPVVTAMKRGAVLLLDEIDLASNKIMALQPVLEGSSIFLKKIGKWVHPADGFTVIATANTKGQGSDDGRFIGTNILNEAFLERFPVTLEQSYPTNKVEGKILTNEMAKHDKMDSPFVSNLVKWADVIRKSFYEGAVDEIISTRRLVHIVNAFSIFDDKLKSISMCISRFDTETADSFLDLYGKVDAGVSVEELLNKPSDEDDEDSEEDEDNQEGYSNV
ncbi:MAG: MoxR family ATPase [Candidatus Poribacteria bacterium]|nr:MoxR family ATPase [Candidatus Poribacteria bacterium]